MSTDYLQLQKFKGSRKNIISLSNNKPKQLISQTVCEQVLSGEGISINIDGENVFT